jgi:hypothetical protein
MPKTHEWPNLYLHTPYFNCLPALFIGMPNSNLKLKMSEGELVEVSDESNEKILVLAL